MADEPIRPGPKLDPFTPPSDSSPYIRTFAKDVAHLTNTPVQQSSAPAAKPVATASEPGTGASLAETVDSVTLPAFDASPVNRPDSAPKEFVQEAVELKKEDSDDIFQQAPRAPDPAFVPTSFVTPTISNQNPIDSDRESVLARLRAKLAQRSTEQVSPTSEQLPPAIPAQVPPPPQPLTQPAPLPLPPPPAPTVVAEPSPIHTYTSDFADHIDQQQATTFSVLAAQSDAQNSESKSTPKRRARVGVLLGASVAVISGISLIIGVYSLVSQQTNNQGGEFAAIPSLVRYDERVEVTGSGSALQQAIASAAGSVTLPGNIVVVYMTQQASTATTTPESDGAALIRALQLPAPAILLRNIAPESTVGIINANGETHPFMVLKVSSYERTFAGMLAWEPRIRDDLDAWYPLYPAAQALPPLGSTSTPTTTPSVSASNNAAIPFFVDIVIANYDARALRDASGRTLMVYGYRGKDLLVIARDEAAFTAIMGRLAASGN